MLKVYTYLSLCVCGCWRSMTIYICTNLSILSFHFMHNSIFVALIFHLILEVWPFFQYTFYHRSVKICNLCLALENCLTFSIKILYLQNNFISRWYLYKISKKVSVGMSNNICISKEKLISKYECHTQRGTHKQTETHARTLHHTSCFTLKYIICIIHCSSFIKEEGENT